MKITIAKIGLLALAAGIALALSSFKKAEITTIKLKAENVVSASESDWDEWQKVSDFVDKAISKEVRKHDGKKASKTAIFSRCPSGYEPNFTSDSVKVDRYVYGKLNNYIGCRANYVCNFKVNVTKKIALVKGKDETEYIAVKDWIQKKYGAAIVKG